MILQIKNWNTNKLFSTGIFQTSFEHFDDSSQLTYLKKALKRHFSGKTHKQEKPKPESRAKTRPDLVDEKATAMRCANICYNIYKNARPYTDYPDQVALYCKAGIWMGDTNHSKRFLLILLKLWVSLCQTKLRLFWNKH